jgi:hypothetical protein
MAWNNFTFTFTPNQKLSEDPSPDIRLDKSEESYETRETSA